MGVSFRAFLESRATVAIVVELKEEREREERGIGANC